MNRYLTTAVFVALLSRHAPAADPVSLTLVLETPSVVVGQPIAYQIHFKNRSTSPQDFPEFRTKERHTARYFLVLDEDTIVHIAPWVPGGVDGGDYFDQPQRSSFLKPGETVRWMDRIWPSEKSLASKLRNPGKHTLKLALIDPCSAKYLTH
jgi:hypothetical protein